MSNRNDVQISIVTKCLSTVFSIFHNPVPYKRFVLLCTKCSLFLPSYVVDHCALNSDTLPKLRHLQNINLQVKCFLMNCQFWICVSFWMGIYYFRSMPTASTKCVNIYIYTPMFKPFPDELYKTLFAFYCFIFQMLIFWSTCLNHLQSA